MPLTIPDSLSYAAYPAATDLEIYLAAAGLSPSPEAASLMGRYCLSAAQEFERRTQWRPFLSGGLSKSRVYDYPLNGLLDLRGGLLSLTSLAVGTATFTQGQQYFLRPDTAPNEGRPYTAVDFGGTGGYGYGGGWGDWGNSFPVFLTGQARQNVRVTGVFGFALTVPPDVWDALLAYAAGKYAQTAGIKRHRGMTGWKEDTTSESYAAQPYQALIEGAKSLFDDAVAHYRRIVVA